MAHTKAAVRAHRKSLKAHQRNTAFSRKIKDIRKKAERAIAAAKLDEAMKFYRELQKTVDTAAKHNAFMKKNTASRYKSNLAKRIRSIAKKV